MYDESLELPSFVKLRHTMRKRCRDYSLDVPQVIFFFCVKSASSFSPPTTHSQISPLANHTDSKSLGASFPCGCGCW